MSPEQKSDCAAAQFVCSSYCSKLHDGRLGFSFFIFFIFVQGDVVPNPFQSGLSSERSSSFGCRYKISSRKCNGGLAKPAALTHRWRRRHIRLRSEGSASCSATTECLTWQENVTTEKCNRQRFGSGFWLEEATREDKSSEVNFTSLDFCLFIYCSYVINMVCAHAL